jgi:4-hydroxy-3-methylbut-2-enyl diphosphate reductase IspH
VLYKKAARCLNLTYPHLQRFQSTQHLNFGLIAQACLLLQGVLRAQLSICYATQNRQDAVKTLMQDSDVLLVLGSSNSSNSNRLREIAEKMQKNAIKLLTSLLLKL